METKVTGYKGFDKNMQCRGFQYKEGETYEHKGDAKLCNEGFHFCEHPLDVLNYYAPATSNFCKVEAEDVSKDRDEDTKRVCSKITIGAKLDLASLTKAAIDFTFEHIKKEKENNKDSKAIVNTLNSGAASNSGYSGAASNSGDRGAASNSGDRGAASNSGDSGAASNSGYSGAASNSGYKGAASNSGDSGAALTTGNESSANNTADNGIAVAWGVNATASGLKGTHIVVTEWAPDKEGTRYELKTAKMIKIDGKRYKENTPYTIKNGKIQEVK